LIRPGASGRLNRRAEWLAFRVASNLVAEDPAVGDKAPKDKNKQKKISETKKTATKAASGAKGTAKK
jgi:hypothetical protein